ncbi:MAG: OmcA/MtrC family decaheme c-type cytochrome [Planctomycetes bacterium]|nr:OmcA/MtrC family decaheme c-type cytochrome [Planctomycetota bacterium]
MSRARHTQMGLGKFSRDNFLLKLLALVGLFMFAMACGDDGKDGAAGEAGAAGDAGSSGTTNAIVSGTAISSVEITSVDVNATTQKTTVYFTMEDVNGAPIIELPSGYTAGSFRFTFAQLIPADTTAGTSNAWQSYINRSRSGDDYENVTQATYEKADAGTLTHTGVGAWSYVFDANIHTVSDPIAVTYNASYRHRVAMQYTGNETNPIYDFIPDGSVIGASTESREIVQIDDCNNCHNKLALHGSGRIDIKYCVTCHNPGTLGVDKNNKTIDLDMRTLTHKIHMGADLPLNGTASGNYTVVGYRDSVHDYSNIHFPRSTGVRDCDNCHIETDKTPQYSNWKTQPSIEACGSCHEDVNFVTGVGHSNSNIIKANGTCATCHEPEEIQLVHTTTAQEALTKAGDFQYNFISANVVAGSPPSVTFSMTNPNDGGSFYDVTASNNTFNIKLGWDAATDYTNVGAYDDNDGASANIWKAEPTTESTSGALSNSDGTYTLTFSENSPATATGVVGILFDGRPAAQLTYDDSSSPQRVPVKNIVSYWDISTNAVLTDAASIRRVAVETNKCLDCHKSIEFHGGQRNNDVQGCLLCHNPAFGDRADIRARFDTVDGKSQESINMAYMIHAIHGAGMKKTPYAVYRDYGRGPVGYQFAAEGEGVPDLSVTQLQASDNVDVELNYNYTMIHYPGDLKDCTVCHTDDGYKLPLSSDVMATATNTMMNESLLDDIVTTPTAAACVACHDSTLSKKHMEQNGASFTGTRADFQNGVTTETCAICHGSDKDADVKTVHGIK